MARGRRGPAGSAKTSRSTALPGAAPQVESKVPAANPRLRGGTVQHAPAPAQQLLLPLPSEVEVLAAVSSLYDDELKPYSRILRKRIAERAEGSGVEAKDCDAGRLRAFCEAHSGLRVEPEEGGEWSVLLVDRPPTFIDIYDTTDSYPEEFWAAAEAYFQGVGEDGDGALPGGRYASAQALASRGLPFLAGLSLGQVCHVTQIAISQRKLLGYHNGAIVPYERSTSMLKSRCAQQQRPLAEPAAGAAGDTAGGGVPLLVVDWEMARAKLREVLESASQRGSEQVPLSNVKRLFRSLYHLELSETALGHSKLTELLQDPRFQDICTVQLQDRGYVVVPVPPPERRVTAEPAESRLEGTGRWHVATEEPCYVDVAPSTSARAIGEPQPPAAAMQWSPLGLPMTGGQRTFVHSRLDPGALPANATRRSRSLPKDLGSGRDSPGPEGGLPLLRVAGPTSEEGEPDLNHEPREDRVRFCPDEPLCVEEAGLFDASSRSLPGFPFPMATPSPQYRCAAVASGSNAWEATCQALGLLPRLEEQPDTVSGEPQAQRVKFCPDEPLCLEEAGLLVGPGAASPNFPFPVMTPSPQYPSHSGTWPPTARPWPQPAEAGSRPLPPAGGELSCPQEARRVQFCPNEPLCLEEAAFSGPGPLASPAYPAWTPSPQYPGSKALLGPRVVSIAGLV